MSLTDGKAIPTERLTLGEDWTLSALRRLVRGALGPRARIWEDVTPDGTRYWAVGLDTQPGRKSLSWGETPSKAVEAAFDPFNQAFAHPSTLPAPEPSPNPTLEAPSEPAIAKEGTGEGGT